MPGIKSSIQKIFESEFYRNILTLFSGMFVARIIPALFAVVIARLYAPADFGLFVLYLTIASVLSIISTGKYENAIILVKSNDEKRSIFRIAQKINTTLNLLVLLGTAAYLVIFKTHDQNQVFLLLMIPVYSYFFSSIQLIRNVFISKNHFKKLSFLEVLRAVLIGVLQCLFFVLPGFGLFLGAVLAQGIVAIFYSAKTPEAVFLNLSSLTTIEKQLAKRYMDFPRYSVLSDGFNFLSSQLPVFIIKPFFGEIMLGLYSFSHRYLSIPVQLLSKSVSGVYLQKCQELKNKDDELQSLTFSLFKKQVVLGALGFSILGLWGQEIFSIVFGKEWEFSGYLAQIISPWLFAVMIGSPLSAILIVREKTKSLDGV